MIAVVALAAAVVVTIVAAVGFYRNLRAGETSNPAPTPPSTSTFPPSPMESSTPPGTSSAYDAHFPLAVGEKLQLPDFVLERLEDAPAQNRMIAGRPLAMGGGPRFRACAQDGSCVETVIDRGFGSIVPGRIELRGQRYEIEDSGGFKGFTVRRAIGA